MLLRMLRTLYRFNLRQIVDSAIITAIRNIDGPIGDSMRLEYYRNKLKSIGANVRIDTSVYMSGLRYIAIGNDVHIDKGVVMVACGPNLDLSARDLKESEVQNVQVARGELIIGDNVHIAQHCMIFAYGGVRIENRCVLSSGCKLYSLTSLPWSPRDRSERGVSIVPYSGRSPSSIGPIELHENVWLGLNCSVFPGVIVEKDCFARTNSVITSSIPENSYVIGDPAKRIDARYK
jgi:acetyltransferase-like isoleucine patch superfamily enzyme